jgi:hypothetical protein
MGRNRIVKEDLRSASWGPRVAGGMMIVASLAMIFAMLHHPTVSAHDIPGFKQEIQRESPVNRLVYGAAIGLTLLLIPCFSWLSSCLRFHLASVRKAMTAFAAGADALDQWIFRDCNLWRNDCRVFRGLVACDS